MAAYLERDLQKLGALRFAMDVEDYELKRIGDQIHHHLVDRASKEMASKYIEIYGAEIIKGISYEDVQKAAVSEITKQLLKKILKED